MSVPIFRVSNVSEMKRKYELAIAQIGNSFITNGVSVSSLVTLSSLLYCTWVKPLYSKPLKLE